MRHDVEYQNHKNRRIELIHEAASESLAGMQPPQAGGVSSNVKRVGIVIMLVAVLLTGSLAQAQADRPPVPQWVRDRLQYETGYVYSPDADAVPHIASSAPQWVRDLLRYHARYSESREAGTVRENAAAPAQRVLERPQQETPSELPYVTPVQGPH